MMGENQNNNPEIEIPSKETAKVRRERIERNQKVIVESSVQLEQHPNDIAALLKRVKAHAEIKKYQEALADRERVIQLEPNYWLGYYYKATVFFKLKKTKQAMAAIEQAIKLKPDSFLNYDLRASLCLRNARFIEVILDCTQGLKLEPTDPRVFYFMRAVAYKHLHLYNLAKQDYEQVQQLNAHLPPYEVFNKLPSNVFQMQTTLGILYYCLIVFSFLFGIKANNFTDSLSFIFICIDLTAFRLYWLNFRPRNALKELRKKGL